MSLHRLLLPVVHHRFKDPCAPKWFHRRIRQYLLDLVPQRQHPIAAYLAALVPLLLVAVLWRYPQYGSQLIPALLLWSGLWCYMIGDTLVRQGRAFLHTGETSYQEATEAVRASLTGHERLIYVAHVQSFRQRFFSYAQDPR